MLITDVVASLRPCRCSGCGAPHHQRTSVAQARWVLDTRGRREEVCGTCANRRTHQADRARRLTSITEPITEPRERRSVLGKVVAGLEIRGVSVLEGVVCECHDSECACRGACAARAVYLWGGVDEDDWQYLCHRCGLRLVDRGSTPSGGLPDQDSEGGDA